MPKAKHSRDRGGRPDFLGRVRSMTSILVDGPFNRIRKKRSKVEQNCDDILPSGSERSSGLRNWIVREQVSLSRLIAFASILLACIWIGWRIVSDAIVQNAAATPEALRWSPHEARLLDRLVWDELIKPNGDLDMAQEWARRALSSNPLDDRALFFLGIIAERNRDHQLAEALIRIAAERTWRNLLAQLWVFEREFRQGDFADALLRVDSVLRINSTLEDIVFPGLASFTANPQSRQVMVNFLATSPPWREWFLSQLAHRLASQARLDRIYADLKQTEKPPTTKEFRFYLDRLIRDRRYIEAYRSWRETLPMRKRIDEERPYNADFKDALDGLQFNWVVTLVPGADIQVVATENDQRALRVEFSGARVDFSNVKQLMLLPAGRYRIIGRVRAHQFRTSRGLWWRLYCADGTNNDLGHTDLVYGNTPWAEFRTDFTVPPNRCVAQWLQLELPARIASERKIEGQIWYKDLRIIPVSNERTKVH